MEIWSGIEIADWFVQEHAKKWCSAQGADGLNITREGDEYNYAWVESYVDHDFQAYFLVDIRTCIKGAYETRDYLFIAEGPDGVECEWQDKPVNWKTDDIHRFQDGMAWFVTLITDHKERHNKD